MYVSAAFSVPLCLSCPLGTSSVAMASRWEDSRRNRRDWSQSIDWTGESRQYWTQSEYDAPSGTSATSGASSAHVDLLATEDAPHFGTSNPKEWTASLRVAFQPVVLKKNKTFVRTPTAPGDKVPQWVQDKQWQKRVDEICSDPKRTVLKSAGSAGPSGSCYQSKYGKQSGPKTCQRPKTPSTYGPGEGSRSDSNVDCFFENYTMAAGTVGSDSKA